MVTLTGDVPAPRSVMTDDAGAFAFGSLPAGSFSVTARKAAYLAAPYGTTRPGRTGTPIALAAAERVSIRITMFKGAAVTGVLRDSAGLPVAGVDVRMVEVRSLAALDDAPALMATSNDLGEYRFYGLLPGEYLVAALPGAGGEINAPSPMDLDATLAALANRTRSTGTVSPTTQPVPVPPVRPIGYAPVFYPGTPHVSDAARLRIGAGEQRAGIDFEVKPVPVASIDGVVSGDVPDLAAVQVSLIPAGPRIATTLQLCESGGQANGCSGQVPVRQSDAWPVPAYRARAPGRCERHRHTDDREPGCCAGRRPRGRSHLHLRLRVRPSPATTSTALQTSMCAV